MPPAYGVAISTTAHSHRMPFLETCVDHWVEHTSSDTPIIVTVDGGAEEWRQVVNTLLVKPHLQERVRVIACMTGGREIRHGRQGVAVNKNTGLEALMELGVEHLLLSDDDFWPIAPDAISTLRAPKLPHLMVCWGLNRVPQWKGTYNVWTWPRGSLLYIERWVVEGLGGFREEFGPGGHEHVEFTRRVHQAGLTPDLYISPTTPASLHWYGEDMPKPKEWLAAVARRRRTITSLRRRPSDISWADRLMKKTDGDTSFVPYGHVENGRCYPV